MFLTAEAHSAALPSLASPACPYPACGCTSKTQTPRRSYSIPSSSFMPWRWMSWSGLIGHSTLGSPGGQRTVTMLMKGFGSVIGDNPVCDDRQHSSQDVKGSSLFIGCRAMFYRVTCMINMYCYVLVADKSETSLSWLSPAWLNTVAIFAFPAEVVGDAGTFGISLCIQTLESAGP